MTQTQIRFSPDTESRDDGVRFALVMIKKQPELDGDWQEIAAAMIVRDLRSAVRTHVASWCQRRADRTRRPWAQALWLGGGRWAASGARCRIMRIEARTVETGDK